MQKTLHECVAVCMRVYNVYIYTYICMYNTYRYVQLNFNSSHAHRMRLESIRSVAFPITVHRNVRLFPIDI